MEDSLPRTPGLTLPFPLWQDKGLQIICFASPVLQFLSLHQELHCLLSLAKYFKIFVCMILCKYKVSSLYVLMEDLQIASSFLLVLYLGRKEILSRFCGGLSNALE